MPIDTIEKWNRFFEIVRPVHLARSADNGNSSRDILATRLNDIVSYAERNNIQLPEDLITNIEGLRTVAYFERAMRSAILNFFRGDYDAFEFIGRMVDLIEVQYRKAWYEGMRAVGADPKSDMTDEFEAVLRGEIGNMDGYIIALAEDIDKARGLEGADIQKFYVRVDLWTNRYNEIVNLAKMTVGGKERLVWRLGRTEQHCGTCLTLHGVVAYADEWRASGYKPQSAPNPLLECGGWRCDCSLVPTKKYRTRGGIPKA